MLISIVKHVKLYSHSILIRFQYNHEMVGSKHRSCCCLSGEYPQLRRQGPPDLSTKEVLALLRKLRRMPQGHHAAVPWTCEKELTVEKGGNQPNLLEN
jgi:hypothetical protein